LNENEPAILAGLFQDVAWIRVSGKGSFQTSPQLRAFAEKMVEKNRTNVVVDLDDCPTMDSTFMGTLTGIALLLQGKPGGRLQVINANTRNLQLLQDLGIDQILDLDVTGEAWRVERKLVREHIHQAVQTEPLSKKEQKIAVLTAHEALCKVNADNVPRFRDVIEYLKEEVKTS